MCHRNLPPKILLIVASLTNTGKCASKTYIITLGVATALPTTTPDAKQLSVGLKRHSVFPLEDPFEIFPERLTFGTDIWLEDAHLATV